MSNLYWPKLRLPRTPRQIAKRRMGRWSRAEAEATSVLVVTHAHCLDGVGSAIMVLRTLGPVGVGVAYVQPGDMAEVLGFLAAIAGRGRRLLVCDLSLQREQFPAIVAACKALAAGNWKVEWRDHHHKQWEGLDLAPLEEAVEVLTVNRDATESGASLVQAALAPNDAALAALAATIRDRDLWWNKTPDSETLEFALTRLGTRRFVAAYLAQRTPGPVVLPEVAKASREERDGQKAILDRLLADARIDGEGERKVATVYGWLPKNTGLHDLIEHGAAIAVNVRPNGKMSLRSRKGADVCHLVCQRFHGGGHPNASGGDLGLKGPRYWWYIARRGRVARVDEVVAAALEELGKAPTGGSR